MVRYITFMGDSLIKKYPTNTFVRVFRVSYTVTIVSAELSGELGNNISNNETFLCVIIA
jgi:hypothetical protein